MTIPFNCYHHSLDYPRYITCFNNKQKRDKQGLFKRLGFLFNLAGTVFSLKFSLSKLWKHYLSQRHVLTSIPRRSILEKCPLKLHSVRCCLDS